MFKILFALLIISNALAADDHFVKKGSLKIGIITAVDGERGKLLELMDSPIVQEKGKRTYYEGKLHGIDTVLVSARIGKVAAAAATTHLICEYKVDLIIFTGVAGAIDPHLNIGDIVVASSLIQHDVDCRPFCPPFLIPLLKISAFKSDPILEQIATVASQRVVEKDLEKSIPQTIIDEYNLTQPKVIQGLVITGDQVISQDSQKLVLREKLPEALCVEMEGASTAQVCYEYGVPFVIIRTISDFANHQHTPVDVKKFVNQASGYYSVSIINNMYELISQLN